VLLYSEQQLLYYERMVRCSALNVASCCEVMAPLSSLWVAMCCDMAGMYGMRLRFASIAGKRRHGLRFTMHLKATFGGVMHVCTCGCVDVLVWRDAVALQCAKCQCAHFCMPISSSLSAALSFSSWFSLFMAAVSMRRADSKTEASSSLLQALISSRSPLMLDRMRSRRTE